jgi:hypothetical protein
LSYFEAIQNKRDFTINFKIILKFLLFWAIIAICTGNISAQTGRPQLSLEIFEKQISGRLEEIFYMPDLNRENQFIFRISSSKRNDDEVKFVTSVVKKTAERIKIKASFSKDEISSHDSASYAVLIDIISLGTKYPGFASNNFLGDKTVKRNLYGSIRVEISSNTVFSGRQDSIKINYTDEVDYREIENIESADYKFTHATSPKVSTFEEIVFPAAIIAVTAFAAVLFFAIRSK